MLFICGVLAVSTDSLVYMLKMLLTDVSGALCASVKWILVNMTQSVRFFFFFWGGVGRGAFEQHLRWWWLVAIRVHQGPRPETSYRCRMKQEAIKGQTFVLFDKEVRLLPVDLSRAKKCSDHSLLATPQLSITLNWIYY